jgi:hypothetical protein
VAGTFIKRIERARAATQTAPRPAEKSLEDMTQEELDVALVESKRRVIEANRAVAAAVHEDRSEPTGTLGAMLGALQRGKRNRRIR